MIFLAWFDDRCANEKVKIIKNNQIKRRVKIKDLGLKVDRHYCQNHFH